MAGSTKASDTRQTDLRCLSLSQLSLKESADQMTKEGPDCVATMAIPDQSLGPVGDLHYCLCLQKCFDKDISPTTISLWIK